MSARRLILAFAAVVAVFAAVAGPAFAAAPETPETVKPTFVQANRAFLEGVLNPGQEGVVGTYEFFYKAGSSTCTGGSKTPEGMSFGGLREHVEQEITGLEPETEYTACLVARNSEGETVGPAVTFKTNLPLEEPETMLATAVTATTATFHGVLNPHSIGNAVPGEYQFFYRASASECEGSGEKEAPQERVPAAGNPAEAVEVSVAGLSPSTTYSFCLFERNNAGERATSQPVTFTSAAAAPSVSEEAVVSVGSDTATVSAQIAPWGLRAHYHVEYVTEAQFVAHEWAQAARVPTSDTELPAVGGFVPVREELSGLQAGAAYRFRFVASNAVGNTSGVGATFTTVLTSGASSLSLPDGRAYELVSPVGNGEVYVPVTFAGSEDTRTLLPFRAAADGGAVAYVGDAPGSGVGGSGSQGGEGGVAGNEYLARRSPGGWSAEDIMPPAAPSTEGPSSAAYQAFSSDLSTGVFSSPDQPPLAGAPADCKDLYSRSSDGGSLAALFTSTVAPGVCGRPLFAGASVDGSRSFFQSEAALIPGAAVAAGSPGQACYYDCNLYESVDGVLSLVNVLPGNGGVDPNAVFGGMSGNEYRGEEVELPDFSNTVSADGSRVFWSDVETGALYVRENGTSTVQVSSGAAKFWTASMNGRYTFYTEGERLVRFDAQSGTRKELAGAGAGVQGVVGISDDGSYVYFVADGALAPGATSQACTGEAGGEGCNLYVLHDEGSPQFVATLAAQDNRFELDTGAGKPGDWRADIGSRTAEVTPDGRAVAFMSIQPLTGYDNGRLPEMFVYEDEAGGGHVFCASCDPSGMPPVEALSDQGRGGFMVPSLFGTFMRRWVSDDGSRVFFETRQSLVARDTNGKVDVYEWERDGSGDCGQRQGCVSLLSGGSSTDESFFIDASSDGNDVFFTTRSQLVPQDGDESVNLYDARAPHVAGETVGFPPVSAPVCTGAGCPGIPPPSGVFTIPSSVTFSGAGNLTPSGAVVKAKRKAKPKAKVCGRGSVRKHGRCVKKAKGSAKHARKGRK